MAFDGSTPCWFPTIPIQVSQKPRMRIAKFGDGYEQRTLDGINSLDTSYQLTFENRERSVILAMDSYLTQRKARAFIFYDPVRRVQVQVFCDEWTIAWSFKTYDAQKNRRDIGTLSAVFRSANGIGIL